MTNHDSPPGDSPGLGQFLIAEYNNIAEAHFKMTETISEFFKHYLTIVSIPIAVLVLILNLGGELQKVASLFVNTALLLSLLFLVISLVGLMMLLYVINLRLDALMYARTINGIRKHFYDTETRMDLATKISVRVLPQSPQTPPYHELRFFGPVVAAFAFLNSLYFILFLAALGVVGGSIDVVKLGFQAFADLKLVVGAGAFLALHYALYRYLARYREDSYLRSNIIGVDIDGVLNDHRRQFCRVLEARVGKIIQEDQIVAIPVRDCAGLGVTKADEIAVFNSPEYWTEMPVSPDAADVLTSVRNLLKLKVFIFTSRPWPALDHLSVADTHDVMAKWAQALRAYNTTEPVSQGRKWPAKWLARFCTWIDATIWSIAPRTIRQWLSGSGWDPVVRITKLWLQAYRIPYHWMLVEKAGENVADPRAHVRNRFHEARTKLIRYFVEDDLLKARKLAFICDIVFLIDHPYNRSGDLPANVIRVKSWNDIYQHMKALS